MKSLVRDLQSREMIRNRSVYGYEETLGINIATLAKKAITEKGAFTWVDMCCGRFNAGLDVSAATLGQALCIGVDVWTNSDEPVIRLGGNCRIDRADVSTYDLPSDVDLVTCVMGLRYIREYEGIDTMLSTIRRWTAALPVGSRLVAEVSDPQYPQEISMEKPPYLIDAFGANTLRNAEDWGCSVLDIIKQPLESN